MSKAQKGVIRPLWLGTAVVTCVVFGSTINKCLTRFPATTPGTGAEAALVRGERLDAPVDAGATGIGEPVTVAQWGMSENPAVEKAAHAPPAPGPDTGLQGLLVRLDLTFDDLASYRYEYPEDGRSPYENDLLMSIYRMQSNQVVEPVVFR